jgi:hypothetical protein
MARDKPSRSRSLLATLLVAVFRLAIIFLATVSRMERAAQLVFLHAVHHAR